MNSRGHIKVSCRMGWERGKNTEYSTNRERRNKVTNNISKLVKLDGLLNVGENNILLETLQFYQSLYSSTCTYPEVFTRDLHHTHLDVDNWLQCDGKLTLQECSLSLNFMKKWQVSQQVVMALPFSSIGQVFVDSLNMVVTGARSLLINLMMWLLLFNWSSTNWIFESET